MKSIIKEELWDALDESGNKLGYDLKRGDVGNSKIYHRVVEIVAFDEGGNVLLTKRSPKKYSYPSCWEITGGSVLKGETAEEGASRELSEETGIAVPPNGLILLNQEVCTHLDSCPDEYSSLFSVFAARFVRAEHTIRLQEGETVDYRFLSAEEFFKFYRDGMINVQQRRIDTCIDKITKLLLR